METKQASQSELGFSPDALAQRKAELLALLQQTAPELISDNQLDLERLKELLGEERIAPAEHYELNWAGKAAARREIQKTSSYTLLPDANNLDRAPHMLIEGENLEVLRVLQKSYHGKVKMIYIDPPYNTGNDSFVYPDDYSETLEEYQKRTGEKNEAGYLNKQSLWKKNSKESGQYHSAWLSMMYPRLYLARNLLREDGVIFISIDDNEATNLKLMCDEIFGEENFVACFTWAGGRKNDSKLVSVSHEYVLCFVRSASYLAENKILWRQKKKGLDEIYSAVNDAVKSSNGDYSKATDILKQWYKSLPNSSPSKQHKHYSVIDKKGVYFPADISWPGGGGPKYDVFHPTTGKLVKVPSRGWMFSDPQKMQQAIKDERVHFGQDETAVPCIKSYLKEKEEQVPYSVFYQDGRAATKRLRALMGNDYFDHPKDEQILKELFEFVMRDGGIAIDFFAGSGSTAQAIMELNIEDNGNRQFICVQLPELLDEKSEAYKAGYRTIADITRARIDKVITKLKANHPETTAELACSHFTLAPSNFKVWNSDIADTGALREQLALFQSAEKKPVAQLSAETQTAMLAELLLKHGLGALGINAISKSLQVAGVTVHRVLMPDDTVMWLCFEPYSAAFKDEIVKAKPAQVVLLNSCFVGDKADELLANLQLELSGLDIGLTVI